MMRCDHCQTLLFDHLYGLLDPAETAAVEEHLAGCAGCFAARSRAAQAQGLLARAAKAEFPQVRFAAPVEVATPTTNRPSRRTEWVRWAIAASVLALIPGTLIPLSRISGRYDRAKRDADAAALRTADAKAAIDRTATDPVKAAQARVASAKDRHDRVVADWLQAEKDADRVAAEAKPAVAITRPASAQPGAPNDFIVAIQDKGNALRGSRVEANVRDRAGTVLFSQKLDPRRANGDTVHMPAEVWSRVAPQTDIFLDVVAVDEATGIRTDLQEPIRLFGPIYAAMLTTDKSSYRPGEWLHFRSLTLDRATFRPPTREQRLHYSLRKQDGDAVPGAVLLGSTGIVRIADGSAETVLDAEGKPIRGVGCGSFALPADLADGDYTLTLTELPGPGDSSPVMTYPVARTVKVRAGAPERFAKKIGFTAPSFGPGQPITAWAEIKLGDKPVAGAKVKVVCDAGDPKVNPLVLPKPLAPNAQPWITGPDGRVNITVGLPPSFPRGHEKLMVTFESDGVTESVAERVPVTGKEIVVEFFPEGGKLIAGVPNRVYVRGTTPAGKPVDVRGAVASGNDIVAQVDSPSDMNEPGVNRGLGVFTITPKSDAVYRLKLPTAAFDLPKSVADGIAMTVLDPVTAPGEPIRVRLQSAGRDRKLVVGAYTRGRLADTKKVAAKVGKPVEVSLLVNPDARGGVTRITVFEEPAEANADLIPVAERLVFRKPGELLRLTATAGAPGTVFAPGSPVELAIAATDEKGNPVPAIVWAAVVNSAAAPAAKDRSLPTHFLFAGEVQTPDDLEYADFLLTDHPKAATVLDHVLATQGWRRFVEQDVRKLTGSATPMTPTDGLQKLNGQMPRAAARASGTLFERYWPQYEESEVALDAAQKQLDAVRPTEATLRQLLATYEESRRVTADLTETVRAAAERVTAIRNTASGFARSLGILALALAGLGVWSGRSLPLFVAAAGTGVLAVLLAVQANRDAATVPDVPGELQPPTPIAKPAPRTVPKLPASPEQVPGGAIVLAPNLEKEQGWLSSLLEHLQHGRDPVVPPAGLDRKPTIPDDLLDPARRVPPRNPLVRSSPLPGFDLTASEKSSAHLEKRAANFAQRIDGAFAGQASETHNRIRAAVPQTPPLVVREFAAPRPGSDTAATDADTVLWQPLIVLPGDGKAKLLFHLGAAPGGYRVLVAGHTTDGRIGSVRTFLPIGK